MFVENDGVIIYLRVRVDMFQMTRRETQNSVHQNRVLQAVRRQRASMKNNVHETQLLAPDLSITSRGYYVKA